MSKSYPVRETWRPRKKRKRPPPQTSADVAVHPYAPGLSGVYLEAGRYYELSYSFTVSIDELWPPALPKEGVSGGPYLKWPTHWTKTAVATPEEEQ